ncbi:MAG: hypothetical protein P8Y69_09840 [Gammaproteobacteria bacterium]
MERQLSGDRRVHLEILQRLGNDLEVSLDPFDRRVHILQLLFSERPLLDDAGLDDLLLPAPVVELVGNVGELLLGDACGRARLDATQSSELFLELEDPVVGVEQLLLEAQLLIGECDPRVAQLAQVLEEPALRADGFLLHVRVLELEDQLPAFHVRAVLDKHFDDLPAFHRRDEHRADRLHRADHGNELVKVALADRCDRDPLGIDADRRAARAVEHQKRQDEDHGCAAGIHGEGACGPALPFDGFIHLFPLAFSSRTAMHG